LADRKEIGVIAYIKRNNSYRFIIVTSRNHPNRWIFPKGQPEVNKADREVAVNEAFEEAGLIGTLQGKPIKVESDSNGFTVRYKLYPFKISKICRKWPERKIRKRRIAKVKKVRELVEKRPYAEALKIFLSKNPL